MTNVFAFAIAFRAYSCRVGFGFWPISNNKISDETKSIFPDSNKDEAIEELGLKAMDWRFQGR